MTLEGHDCWEDCDEGPHGCVCGNDCPPPPWHEAAQPAPIPGGLMGGYPLGHFIDISQDGRPSHA